MGIDGHNDVRSLDTGSQQFLARINNGFCDTRGQMVRDPGADKVQGEHPVLEVEFYSQEKVVYAEQDGAGINLVSEDNHIETGAFPLNSNVNTTVFNKRVHFFSPGQGVISYDGNSYTRNQSPALALLRPAFGATVARRMAVAGIPGLETQVHFSRVDNHEVFPEDEAIDEPNVLRAGFIDIANQIDRAEAITGISKFEQLGMAIFTSDRTLIYRIDPNIDAWTLDERASINVGCVSHATIQRAGTDVLFCSRYGIHFLRRSISNGITIDSSSLSARIEILYRNLLRTVENVEDITAFYDPDMQQYHVYFPQPGGILSKRLTVTLRPDDTPPSWSTADFLNARCGSFLRGRVVVGTSGGIYDVGNIEEVRSVNPTMEVVTPILWHGDFNNTKMVSKMTLQASGNGVIKTEVTDPEEDDYVIAEDTVEVSFSPDDNNYPDVPLYSSYEIPIEAQYRGGQYKFTVTGEGLCRIVGFALAIREK